MRAGTLNIRVTIQSPATGQDEYGQPLAGWTDAATVWAAIRDLKGAQYIAAQATQNQVESKITIRYRPGITSSMRVVHGADVYDIQSVLGQDRKTLDLMVKRGVSDG